MKRKSRPSVFRIFWYRLTGRNPYAPQRPSASESKSLKWSDIVKNYNAYRQEKRKYKAHQRILKLKERQRRKEERRNETENPFYQLLFSHEITRKVMVNEDGVVVYRPSVRNSILHVFNSLASFLVAYLLVYLSYQLVVLITASFHGIDSILYYYKLDFNDHSQLWDVFNIIVITLSGPANSLIMGFLFYNYLFFKAKSYPNLQLFFLWTGLLFFAHFFAAFIAGVVTNKGFGYVPIWLFWNDFTKFFFAIVALASLVLIGYFGASRFLATTNTNLRIQKNQRALFYLHQVVLPYLLGFLIIFLVKIPNNYAYDTGILAFSAFMFGAVFFHVNAFLPPYMRNRNKVNSLNWVLILLAIVSLYSYRVYLEEGLHFVIKLTISITRAGSDM